MRLAEASQNEHQHPGVAWGKADGMAGGQAQDPSVHPVEDLADQVH